MLLGLLGASCYRSQGVRVYKLDDMGIKPALKELVQNQPEYFNAPYTLLILVDGSPCGKLLQETMWWDEWQETATEAGYGFVLVTSRADSAGLVWAAQLDSVDSPVLVMPGCEDYLLELGMPRGFAPLKLLIDSTAHIHQFWSPFVDTADCNRLMYQLDSLSCSGTRGAPEPHRWLLEE